MFEYSAHMCLNVHQFCIRNFFWIVPIDKTAALSSSTLWIHTVRTRNSSISTTLRICLYFPFPAWLSLSVFAKSFNTRRSIFPLGSFGISSINRTPPRRCLKWAVLSEIRRDTGSQIKRVSLGRYNRSRNIMNCHWYFMNTQSRWKQSSIAHFTIVAIARVLYPRIMTSPHWPVTSCTREVLILSGA